MECFFFFSSRRRHTRYWRDWSSDVCSSDLARLARRRQRVAVEPADPDQAGAERDGLDDVAAAAEPTVYPDLCTAFDGADDLRQHLDRATAVVELAAAVVRDVDHLGAVLAGD